MSKSFRWFCRFFAAIVVFFVVTAGLGVLLATLLVTGFQEEWNSRKAPAENTLNSLGLNAYAQYAPPDHLTIGDSLAAFTMFKYDNREDNTDLHAGIMAHAVTADGWHTDPVSAAAYAACLHRTLPEAAFLFPEDSLAFDAWYQAESGEMGFFDQDTGLTVWFDPSAQPAPGSIRADRLTVPHNGYVYTMETHGGFHGDGTTFYALIVPEEKRAAFEQTISSHADWHDGTVTHAEYAVLQSCFSECPELLPSADVTFDWWSHVDAYARSHPDEEPDFDVHPDFPAVMREAGARWSLNWLVALYDVDTGLFIYYQTDM